MNSYIEKEYKVWEPREWWEQLGLKEEVNKIEEALNNKRIKNHTGEDKLHWRFRPKGLFTIKEAYDL